MTTQENTRLSELKRQLDAVYSTMPNSFFEQQQRDKSAFLISREIEAIENPKGYQDNIAHWEGYEMRF